MSLLPVVGRKAVKSRVFVFFVYSALILLGSTMVVPFLITVTGSVSNNFDYDRFWPVPRFFWSQKDRFVKCMVPYFNAYRGWQKQMTCAAPATPNYWNNWSMIGRDVKGVDQFAGYYLSSFQENSGQARLSAADYAEFSGRYSLADKVIYVSGPECVAFLMSYYLERYKDLFPEKASAMSGSKLRQEALMLLSEEWGLPFESFYNINFKTEMKYPMGFQGWYPPLGDPKYKSYAVFKKMADAMMFTPGIKSKWLSFLKNNSYSYEKESDVFPVMAQNGDDLKTLWMEFKKKTAPASPAIPYAMRANWYDFLESEEVSQLLKLPSGVKFNVKKYNKMAGTFYNNLYRTPFPVPASFKNEIRALWKKFKQERYPLRLQSFIKTSDLNFKLQAFMKKTLKHLKVANKLLGTKFSSWDQITVKALGPGGSGDNSRNRRDILKNFMKSLPVSARKYTSSESDYQKYLLKKYGSVDNINKKYGWKLKYIEEAFPPFMDAYTVTFTENQYNLSFRPLFRNYSTVIDYLLFNGRAILVTILLVTLTIAFTLTVNPLAAYALSRFNLRGQDKILIFLLATMAFPAMVSAIPAYLLMRDLGLLNTFWALVLPTAANGMAIFILKGFFDSLPMELFEAATIDGASEMQIFRIVAMPLVKPILAINCLNAFIMAYNGWQWALIICQDKKMWTIAVWLYQASSWWVNDPWIVSAGFVVASIPTMLIFISCQKIILRGIIIPSMK